MEKVMNTEKNMDGGCFRISKTVGILVFATDGSSEQQGPHIRAQRISVHWGAVGVEGGP